MLTLYGSTGSGSAAIEAALTLTGRPFRAIDEAASWEPGPGFDALRRLNPLGQVPALVLEDGSVLTESAAILIHLGLADPAGGLLPAGEAERAQALRGLVFIVANCYAMIGVIDYPERICPGADDALRERIRSGAKARLHALWEQFADLFGDRIAPHAPDALALLAAVVSRWSGARAHLAAARPAFAARLAAVDAHPRLAEMVARHWPHAAS